MPANQKTVLARAHKAAQAQAKRQAEADYLIACFSIKNNAEAIQSVKGHLTSNGWWNEQGFLSEEQDAPNVH